MERQNLILVFDPSMTKILVCKRRKPPYAGCYNLVGGKVKENESALEAAYRELEEESCIHKNNIKLIHLMDLTYYPVDRTLEVFVGRIKEPVYIDGDENPLFWSPVNNFRCNSSSWIAGDGNVVHIVEYAMRLSETNRLPLG